MCCSKFILIVCGFFSFFGCAGVGVFYTSDPAIKLSDAKYLEVNRPLIAERLILEAIDIYQQRNDVQGLAYSYFSYANFLRSKSIKSFEYIYRKDGFLNKEVTYDNRLEKSKEYVVKSLEYYKQAEKQYIEANKFDGLSHVYYISGWLYWMLADKDNCCKYFSKSLDANAENLRRIPDAKVSLPQGYTSFKEFVLPIMNKVGCKIN